ncbi:hypothetical protein NQ315_006694 [Exocentrus adspersus]|uniref:Uncharacterized protein n=1 Tax=Exocentrus adspersus TaxID=1586481 RepID=A0AAV8WBD5_9CUCU|nr:hypothetical protein NQ315_006694 [Exocentrus adspersus]
MLLYASVVGTLLLFPPKVPNPKEVREKLDNRTQQNYQIYLIMNSNVSVECYYSAFKNSSYEFYRKILYNGRTYTTEDFFLINGDNNTEVAQILCIFCDQEKVVQFVVRKYIFARNMRKFLSNDDTLWFDENNEVVQDCTQDYIIGEDSIIRKCYLLIANENEGPYIIEENNLDSCLYFSCRFAMRSDGLFPILGTPSVIQTNNFKSPIMKSKSYSAKKPKYKIDSASKNSTKSRKTSNIDTTSFSPLQRNSVKRNLNVSFGTCHDETDSLLNYSIVKDDDDNSLILKLKVSDSSKKLVIPITKLDESLSPKKNSEVGNMSTRKSTRNVQRISYADYISPVKSTPKKRNKTYSETENLFYSEESSDFVSAGKKVGMLATPKKLRNGLGKENNQNSKKM